MGSEVFETCASTALCSIIIARNFGIASPVFRFVIIPRKTFKVLKAGFTFRGMPNKQKLNTKNSPRIIEFSGISPNLSWVKMQGLFVLGFKSFKYFPAYTKGTTHNHF